VRVLRFSVLAAAIAAFLAISTVASANPGRVVAQDDCDAASFNAAVPANPPTCVGDGTTTFDSFIGQLVDHKFAGSWHFAPNRVNVKAGSSLVFENRGGETHSLTQVTQFGGGGIVPPLNLILFGTTTPPTFFFPPLNIVPAGGSLTIPAATLTPGTHLFFCAIHPWMQETVTVS
jgi:plastocyanin